MTALDIAITDDWELRGDGSGDMRVIQFETGRRFAQIFADEGLAVSFNVEVMQQLRHRELGGRFPSLAELADQWEQNVHELYGQGHDIQLHVHTQWSDADYTAEGWVLKGDWSMLRYGAQETRAMLSASKSYLEELMRRVDSDYRCVAYRAGGWCLAPSPHLVDILESLGITLDISITLGLHYDQLVDLDYRYIDEPYEPFYPQKDDARHVADTPGSLVCVPVAHLQQSSTRRIFEILAQRVPLIRQLVDGGEFLIPSSVPIAGSGANRYGGWGHSGSADGSRPSLLARIGRQVTARTITADISAMNLFQVRLMLGQLKRLGRSRGLDRLPVVLAHHTKDMGDTAVARGLASMIRRDEDLRTVTLQELASRLVAGQYRVRYAGH